MTNTDIDNLYTGIKVGKTELNHRVVLAPLTRFRSNEDRTATDLMVEYYSQRATVPGTLLITEATFISERSGLYPNAPGIWSEDQIRSWKKVSDAVHAKGSSIFMQLWALGKAGSKKLLNQKGYDYVAPSALAPKSPNVITREVEVPREMTKAEIKEYVQDFAQAAKNAIAAGMDGVELHGAHGYLLNQFYDAYSNQRTDEYGGSIENKCRFLFEVLDATIEAVGADRVALRLSPWLNTDLAEYDTSPIPVFSYIATEIERRARVGNEIAYIHIVEPRVAGVVDVEEFIGSNDWFRHIWSGNIVRAGGYLKELAEEHANKDDKTLIAFGRRFIPNPELPKKLEKSVELTPYNRKTFYSSGAEGYTSYIPSNL